MTGKTGPRHASVRPSRPIGWRGRVSIGLIAAGTASVGAGAMGLATAHAAAAPGSNFANVDITSTATGIQQPEYSHQGEDVENEAPYAQSNLESGGTGHALTSVYWPGGTGGHGGSTLYLLGQPCIPPNPDGLLPVPCPTHAPPLPDQVYQALDDPYKAEAQTGAGKPTVKNSSPGADMTATAKPDYVFADTHMDASAVPSVGETFGKTVTTTTVHVTGPNSVVVDAFSSVHNVSLGAGAITIKSVTSIAHATSNGQTASGSASTTVHGMEIAGTPVTVDDKGIHAGGQGSGLPDTSAVNAALKQAGFEIYIAKPSKTVTGAGIALNSGNLIFRQTNSGYTGNANDTGNLLIVGGAVINADTSRGTVYHPPTPGPTASSTPPPTQQQTTGGGGGGVPPVGSGPSTITGGSSNVPPSVGTSPPPQLPPRLASSSSPLPTGISPGWIVAVLLGSGLMAAGFKRLPDSVLASGGTPCTAGETT